VMGAMFIILPMFWMGALGWAGISAGNALSGLTDGSRSIQQAGGAAGGLAQKGIKSIASGKE